VHNRKRFLPALAVSPLITVSPTQLPQSSGTPPAYLAPCFAMLRLVRRSRPSRPRERVARRQDRGTDCRTHAGKGEVSGEPRVHGARDLRRSS